MIAPNRNRSMKDTAPVSDTRRRLLAAVHAEAKAAGLDEDARRDVIESVGGPGVRSAADLSDKQLRDVLARLKRGGAGRLAGGGARTRPAGRVEQMERKILALWLSAYWLGVVEDGSDEALLAFVRRQTQADGAIQALRFLDVEAADRVIEGLKAWMARDAGVNWAAGGPRLAVALALWRRLAAHGAAPHPIGLKFHVRAAFGRPVEEFEPAEWVRLHQDLGARLRRAMGLSV